MKTIFPEFYQPTEEEFSQLWKNCIFSFDANILLHTYQISEDTHKTFLSILENFKRRVWLTHQAAYEYHKNINSRIEAQITELKEDKNEIIKALDEIYNKTKNRHHPTINYKEISSSIKEIKNQLDSTIKSQDKANKYGEFCQKNKELIAELFDKKVGSPYSSNILAEKIEKAQKRYEQLIPPGFMDWKTKQSEIDEEKKQPGRGRILPTPYGDALIWFQLVDHGKTEQKPIIFVTDDKKVDWWWYHSGKILGPRPELIAEMQNEAQVKFYMYDFAGFLKYGSTQISNPPEAEELNSAILELLEMDKSAFRNRLHMYEHIIRELLVTIGIRHSMANVISMSTTELATTLARNLIVPSDVILPLMQFVYYLSIGYNTGPFSDMIEQQFQETFSLSQAALRRLIASGQGTLGIPDK